MSIIRSTLLLLSVAAVIQCETVSNDTDPLIIPKPMKNYSLDIKVRHQLIKAHGILMVFAWLFFIPSAFVFARMLRDGWRGKKVMGLAVWFQVHRTFNIIGIVLMIASFVLVMTAKDWTWTGPGSHSKYYTKVHTLTGLISLILAWLQPFLSLIRCGPAHHLRWLFNWSHRLLGVAGFALATTALTIAALEFQKLWQDYALQTVLMLAPSLLLILLSISSLLFNTKKDNEERSESGYSIRISLSFWAIGMMMAICVVLSILIAQGYKPPPPK